MSISTNPVTFVVALILVVATSELACRIPARRAVRTDPMQVMREG